jgi:hypothetical protein
MAYDIRNLVYSTPYSAHKNLAHVRLLRLRDKWNRGHPDHKVALADLPSCELSEQTQSRSYDFVWYDPVVDKHLGFLNDNKRVTTHVTRAINFVWIVCNPAITAAERDAYATSSIADESDSGNDDEEQEPLLPRIFGSSAVEGRSKTIVVGDTGEDDRDIEVTVSPIS